MTPLSKILQAHALNSDVDLTTVKILVNRENINLLPFFEPQQKTICHVLLDAVLSGQGLLVKLQGENTFAIFLDFPELF